MAKCAIISDIHANIEALTAVLEDIDAKCRKKFHIDLLDKGDSTVADMAELLYPDIGKKTRESIVRVAIMSLMRKNKVQAGHMQQRHRMYTTDFKPVSKMDPVKIDNMKLLKEMVAVTVNRKKDYE